MLGPWIAHLANGRGQHALEVARDFDRAERWFARAAAWAPGWSAPWFNRGLAAKWQRRWAQALACNHEALARDPNWSPAWWNLGIAATALGDWAEARRAWTAYGIALPPGDGEPRLDLGRTPIRLDPQGRGEVVWCDRIDPARAIIRNVPLPGSGYRYGDLLLHDGVPSGERRLHGAIVSVYDSIERLQSSNSATFAVTLIAPDRTALTSLFSQAAQHDLGLEDWGTLRCLCRACSQGPVGAVPDEDEDDADPVPIPFTFDAPIPLSAAAPDRPTLEALLHAWQADHPGGRVVTLEPITSVLVPETPAPGG